MTSKRVNQSGGPSAKKWDFRTIGNNFSEEMYKLNDHRTETCKKYGFMKNITEFTINPDTPHPDERMRDAIEDMIKKAFKRTEETMGRKVKMFGVTLTGSGLDYPVYLPYRPYPQNNADVVMEEINKLGQSGGENGDDKRTILLSRPVQMNVTCVALPAGEGPRNVHKFDYGFKEHQRIQVNNNDKLCLFYALAASRNYLELHVDSFRRFMNNMTRQKEAALELLHQSGVNDMENGYGIEHLSAIQKYWDITFPGKYRIAAFEKSADPRRSIRVLWKGPMGHQAVVPIFLEDNHWDGLKNFVCFFNKGKKFCIDCECFYDKDVRHTNNFSEEMYKLNDHRTETCKKFGFMKNITEFTINPDTPYPDERLRDAIEDMINKAFKRTEETMGRKVKMFGVTLTGSGLGYPVYLPYRPYPQNNADVVMEEINKLGQSGGENGDDKRTILLSRPVQMNVTCVALPAGEGPRNVHKFDYGFKEHQRIKVNNNDKFCLFYALVASKNYLELHRPTFHRFMNNMTRQREAALELLHKSGVSDMENAYGVEHLSAVQKYLDQSFPGKYRIAAFEKSVDPRRSIRVLWKGPMGREAVLPIFLENNHWDGLKNYDGVYHTYECKARCYYCNRVGGMPCTKERGVKIECPKCRRYFYNQQCFNHHQRHQTCNIWKRCVECNKTYLFNPKSKHECGETFCRSCGICHDPKRGCFIKPILVKEEKDIYRIVVWDSETSQDKTYKGEQKEHVINYISARATFNLDCEDKPFFPYYYNKKENYNTHLPHLPPMEDYSPGSMKKEKFDKFEKWYNENKETPFYLPEELKNYCRNDTEILLKSIIEFRRILVKDITGGFDPLPRSCTNAGVAMSIFKAMFLQEEELSIVPERGYERCDRASVIAIKYLEWRSKRDNVDIKP
uniref:DNA-directed DNA polymerase n=1 Tax=Globodera pallida TaxID=36090 RepID=A0A183CI53_GLOPA